MSFKIGEPTSASVAQSTAFQLMGQPTSRACAHLPGSCSNSRRLEPLEYIASGPSAVAIAEPKMMRPWRIHSAFAFRRPVVQCGNRYTRDLANLVGGEHFSAINVIHSVLPRLSSRSGVWRRRSRRRLLKARVRPSGRAARQGLRRRQDLTELRRVFSGRAEALRNIHRVRCRDGVVDLVAPVVRMAERRVARQGLGPLSELPMQLRLQPCGRGQLTRQAIAERCKWQCGARLSEWRS